jgi:hypothetical protein
MANNYKKVMTTVTSTGDATIYTVPAETTTLIKTAWAYNNSGGAANITLKINSTALGNDPAVADKSAYRPIAIGEVGVLEEADILKINNDVQPVNVYLAILEIS